MVNRLRPKQDLESERLAFGKRLEDLVLRVSRVRETTRKNTEKEIVAAAPVPVSPDRFRRWYKGANVPDAVMFSVILDAIEQIYARPIDLEYLLRGTPQGAEARRTSVEGLHQKIAKIDGRLASLTAYLQDHELGVEGVLMRQSARLLEDLRRSRLTQPRSLFDDSTPEPLVAGFLPDELVEIAECCSVHTRLVDLSLDYEMMPEPTGLRTGANPGRAFYALVESLSSGAGYEYILAGSRQMWEPKVNKLLAQLDQAGVHPEHLANISFSCTEYPLGAGFCLMQLDLENLRGRRDFLAGELEDDYVTKAGVLGMVSAPSTKMHGVALMSRERVALAELAWEKYRKTAHEIAS